MPTGRTRAGATDAAHGHKQCLVGDARILKGLLVRPSDWTLPHTVRKCLPKGPPEPSSRQHTLLRLSHLQAAPGFSEDIGAEVLFKHTQLAADEARRQMQLFAGHGEAAALGDGPEVA